MSMEFLDKMFSRPHLLLAVIILMGFLLRLYGLGSESLWLDEGISYIWASQSIPDIMNSVADDVHFPLYYLVLHGWISIAGTSEFALRFLSLVFGTLSIPVLYLVARTLFNRKTALLSSLFLSLSVFHVYFSQEVRVYSLLGLLSLLSMLFFIRLLRRKTPLDSSLYVISTILMSYTHPFGLLTIFSQFLYMVLRKSQTRNALRTRHFIILQAAVMAALIPWIWVLAGQLSRLQSPGSTWIPVPGPLELVKVFAEFFPCGLLAFFPLLFYIYFKSRPLTLRNPIERESLVLLITWMAFPVTAAFLFSLTFSSVFLTKYLIASSFPLYILVARIVSGKGYPRARKLAIGGFIIISLACLAFYHAEVNKEQWREATVLVEMNAEPGDLVLFHAGYCRFGPFDYYLTRDDLEIRGFQTESLAIENDLAELPGLTEGHDRIWLIYSHSTDQEGLIQQALSGTHSLVERRIYDSMEYLDFLEPYMGTEIVNSIEVLLFQKQE